MYWKVQLFSSPPRLYLSYSDDSSPRYYHGTRTDITDPPLRLPTCSDCSLSLFIVEPCHFPFRRTSLQHALITPPLCRARPYYCANVFLNRRELVPDGRESVKILPFFFFWRKIYIRSWNDKRWNGNRLHKVNRPLCAATPLPPSAPPPPSHPPPGVTHSASFVLPLIAYVSVQH